MARGRGRGAGVRRLDARRGDLQGRLREVPRARRRGRHRPAAAGQPAARGRRGGRADRAQWTRGAPGQAVDAAGRQGLGRPADGGPDRPTSRRSCSVAVDVERVPQPAPPARVPAWQRGRVASWLVTVDHKRIGILYIATAGSLLPRRRPAGRADADAARAGGRRLPHARLLQRGHDHARDDDGLPRRRAHPGRLRQLPRPADDRRPRHGLPAPERDVLLALPLRRDRPDALVLRLGRRGEVGLDGVPAALAPGRGERPGPLDPRRCTSSRSRRSPGRSTSSSRSRTCARAG